MKYISLGMRSRAYMVNLAFAKEFGIPLDHETVVKTPAEYAARMKAVEEEMRREQRERELREIVKRNQPIACSFSFVLHWHMPDREKLSRLKVVAKDKRNEIKLPPNLSLAHQIFTTAIKRRPSIAKKLKKCAEMVYMILSAHKRLQGVQ